MWEMNQANLQAGMFGNPQDPVTLLRYWQMQERVHYPYAREMVEYMKDEVERMQAAMQQQAAQVMPAGAQAAQGAQMMPAQG
jgi:hypothetical protein